MPINGYEPLPQFAYHTGIYFNQEGKMYRIIYGFAWMDFRDQSVLVIQKK